MSDSEINRILGALGEAKIEHGKQLDKVFAMLHDMRTNGLPVCKQHSDILNDLKSRVGNVEMTTMKLVFAILASGCVGAGGTELVKALFGGG